MLRLLLVLLLASQTVKPLPPSSARADFGAAGQVRVRFVARGEAHFLEVYRARQKVYRTELEWNLRLDDLSFEALWLHPREKTGPMLTVKDWDSLLVVTFPDGLRGRVVAKMFNDGSSSISATTSFVETDAATGTTMVVQEISEQDGPTLRTEYHWKDGGWKVAK